MCAAAACRGETSVWTLRFCTSDMIPEMRIPETEPFPLMAWRFPSLNIAAITGVTVERQKLLRMFDNPATKQIL